MKKTLRAAVVAAAVLAVPALGLAAQTKPAAQTAPAAPAKAKSDAKAAKDSTTVYSAKGVVKSIDGSTLVLTEKPSKKKRSHDVRFVLDPSVQKDANIAAGSTVRVKYHNDAKKHVATEIREGTGKKS